MKRNIVNNLYTNSVERKKKGMRRKIINPEEVKKREKKKHK